MRGCFCAKSGAERECFGVFAGGSGNRNLGGGCTHGGRAARHSAAGGRAGGGSTSPSSLTTHRQPLVLGRSTRGGAWGRPDQKL